MSVLQDASGVTCFTDASAVNSWTDASGNTLSCGVQPPPPPPPPPIGGGGTGHKRHRLDRSWVSSRWRSDTTREMLIATEFAGELSTIERAGSSDDAREQLQALIGAIDAAIMLAKNRLMKRTFTELQTQALALKRKMQRH